MIPLFKVVLQCVIHLRNGDIVSFDNMELETVMGLPNPKENK